MTTTSTPLAVSTQEYAPGSTVFVPISFNTGGDLDALLAQIPPTVTLISGTTGAPSTKIYYILTVPGTVIGAVNVENPLTDVEATFAVNSPQNVALMVDFVWNNEAAADGTVSFDIVVKPLSLTADGALTAGGAEIVIDPQVRVVPY